MRCEYVGADGEGWVDFNTKFSCTIADWAGTGHRVPDTKVDYMLKVIIPMAIEEAVSTGRYSAGPVNSRSLHAIVAAASNYKQPTRYAAVICRKCNRARDEQEYCGYCPGKQVTCADGRKEVHKVADWVEESVLIWDLEDLIEAWMEDEEVSWALLNHLRDVPGNVEHSSLHSERCRFFRHLLMSLNGNDDRLMIMGYHSDGFAPQSSRPNTFSLTYGIVNLMLGHIMNHRRSALKVWWLTNGPRHCLSTSWFDHILLDQIKKVLYQGVECTWPHHIAFPIQGGAGCECGAGAEQRRCTCTKLFEPGKFRCHACIGCSCSDQPATQLNCGCANHNAELSCT